jgi:superfamily II DNA or RNA helicase
MLTATPIQIGSDNLYQLLRLVDPDQFYDSFLFQEMLSANSSIVRAQRALWQEPVNVAGALAALSDADKSDYFKNDAILARIREHLAGDLSNAERRIEILRLLESRSLLAQYMTRSRKREVLNKRVERAPQVLSVRFSPEESSIYQHVTDRIRKEAVGRSGVSLFSLIARQRQMASSIVGALESWRDKGLIEDLLWEDFGVSQEFLSGSSQDGADGERENEGVSADPAELSVAYDIASLEKGDNKYRGLKEFLTTELQRNTKEKFVVFAFYRGTLKYLFRRLKADGVNVTLMMGDMAAEKDNVIRAFARPDGPSVLLSSEVGSEGIDLQFCRFLVNYDLPWNPMRVEQRIGRLDRLGQKAERISIINLAVENTIEDRILLRLYNRINVFRESIGDLEDILGEVTERLLVDLLNPNLTDEERERKSAQAELAVHNTQKERQKLEEEAVNLIGFSDYILDHVKESREKGRWLSAFELRALVDDFFARNFPGTKVEQSEELEYAARIVLSDEARTSLGYFIAENRPSTRTMLHRGTRPVFCVFDPRKTDDVSVETEFIEPSHPLIQWIRAKYQEEQEQLHPVAAIAISEAQAGVPRGDYVFSAHRWSFNGFKSDQLLSFRACKLGEHELLGSAQSEALVTAGSRFGEVLPNAVNVLPNVDDICGGAISCEEALGEAFGERLADFEAENKVRCDQQRTSAEKLARRRLEGFHARIDRFRREGNVRPIAMTEASLERKKSSSRLKWSA